MSPDKLLFKRLAANGRPIFAAQPHHTYQMAEGRRNDQQRDSSSGQSQVFMSETETQSSDAPVEKFIVSAPSAVQPVSSQSQSSSSGMSSDCYSSPLFVPRGRAYAFGASSNHKRRKRQENKAHEKLGEKTSFQLKDEQIRTLKVIVIGDPYTGKTSLLKCYTQRCFNIEYEETAGNDFISCTVECNGKDYRINFWDTAGQERYVRNRRESLNRLFYKDSSAAFVVFDSSKPSTLNCVTEWKEIIDFTIKQKNGNPIPVFLLANKCDLAHFEGNLDSLCRENGFANYFECSAKNCEGIDNAVKAMVKKVLESGPEIPPVTCNLPFQRPVILNDHLPPTPTGTIVINDNEHQIYNVNSKNCTCAHA